MREHPILFSDEMVRAILEGRKTQTIRPLKKKHHGPWDRSSEYRTPGDHLWVRECWSHKNIWVTGRNGYGGTVYRADGDERDFVEPYGKHRWHPSIHMPRDRCRLILEIDYCEIYRRLSNIDGGDLLREGFDLSKINDIDKDPFDVAEKWFIESWDSMYGKGSFYQTGPVWVYHFKVLDNDQFKGQFAGCLPKETNQ